MSETQKEIAPPASKPQDKQKTGFFTTKKITSIAMLAALSMIIKLIGNALTFTPTFRVSFIYIPWLLSGIILGPIGGCLVSGTSDLLVMLLLPGSTFIPLTFVSNLIYPLFIGIIYNYAPIKNDYIKVVLGAIPSLFICTLGIGSIALYYAYGYYNEFSFFEYLAAYRIMQPAVFAINLVLLCLLISPLKSVKIIPERNEDASFNAGLVFVISEVLLLAVFITGMVFLIIYNAASSAYILIISLYVILALYISLILMKNFGAGNRLALTLLTLGTLCAVALAINLFSSAPDMVLTIVLSSTGGILLISGFLLLVIRKLRNAQKE